MTIYHPVKERILKNQELLRERLQEDLELTRVIKIDLAKLVNLEEMAPLRELEKCLEKYVKYITE
jgi:hypothetical protein